MGQGVGETIIDGNGTMTGERVLDLPGLTGDLTMTDLTVQHGGNGNDGGAGIRVAIGMTLTLDRVLVMANNAGTGDGGASITAGRRASPTAASPSTP